MVTSGQKARRLRSAAGKRSSRDRETAPARATTSWLAWVDGYWRSDGVWVSGHYRPTPGSVPPPSALED